jgi:hypothetical protein
MSLADNTGRFHIRCTCSDQPVRPSANGATEFKQITRPHEMRLGTYWSQLMPVQSSMSKCQSNRRMTEKNAKTNSQGHLDVQI